MEHGGHLLFLLIPLAVVALFRARQFVPVALLLLTFTHNHQDPLPGTVTATPPPICCVLAQSLEAAPTKLVAAPAIVARLPLPQKIRDPQTIARRTPTIRAPPSRSAPPTPASWTPVFRAA